MVDVPAEGVAVAHHGAAPDAILRHSHDSETQDRQADPERLAYFLLKGVRQAIKDFDLIHPRDRVAVAVSGGKDSLSLLRLLQLHSRTAGIPFELAAVHVCGDATGVTPPHPPLEDWLAGQGVRAAIVEPEIAEAEVLPLTCQRCTWLRRKAIFLAADALGCNVVAYAHHADDVAQTTLLNLLYGGNVFTLEPTADYFGGRFRLIRPLFHVPESELARFAAASGFPPPPPACPRSGSTRRLRVAEMLKLLGRDYLVQVRTNLVRAGLRGLKGSVQREDSMTEAQARSPAVAHNGAGPDAILRHNGAREFAIALAMRTGDLLMEYQRRGLLDDEVRTKSSDIDIVTVADEAADRLISEAVRAAFPEHVVYSEESAVAGPPAAEWLWVVDPVDGTSNFARGLPIFAVSMALAHRGVPILAVTLDPVCGRCYWAEQGGGAWLRLAGEDHPLRVSATAELRRCLLGTGFPHDRLTNEDNNLTEFVALKPRVHGVRRTGSAALEMAWVAAGILDGYWCLRLQPWDCAAGWLLIREAGGLVTDYDGQQWRLDSASLIASNGRPAVHAELQSVIAAARAALSSR